MFSACSKKETGGSSPSAVKEKITFRIGAGHPVTFPWITTMDTYFVPEVTKRMAAAGYESEWVKAWGGSVIKLGEELTGIEDGLVDIGATVFVFEPARLMLHGFTLRLPFSCGDPLVVAKIMKTMLDEFPVFTTEFEKYNQKFLGFAVTDPYTLFSSKPVTRLEDVGGWKIGAAGANLSWIENSGATPVQSTLPDAYQNIQTNVFQATIMPMGVSVNASKLPEVAPYVIDASFNCLFHNSIAINLDKWKSLPKEVQDILVAVGKEFPDIQAKEVAAGYQDAIEKIKAIGGTVTSLSREEQARWAARLNDVPSVMIKELNERGYPGNAIAKRYYELLGQNGWPMIRQWNLN